MSTSNYFTTDKSLIYYLCQKKMDQIAVCFDEENERYEAVFADTAELRKEIAIFESMKLIEEWFF